MTVNIILVVIVGVLAGLYFIWWFGNLPEVVNPICDYCRKRTYLGHFKESPEDQHWRPFPCRHCGAELVHK